MLLELQPRQLAQYIDAAAVFTALQEAKWKAWKYRGSMFWRQVKGKDYLIRMDTRGAQKSLGPKNDMNQNAAEKFMGEKAAIEGRLKSLRAEMKLHQRMNRALNVGRAPEMLIDTINVLEEAGLSEFFLLVGTHAIHAYEAAVGARTLSETVATQDVDYLYDTRKQVKFLAQMHALDASLLSVFKKADSSFEIRADQKYTAVNERGFEVDVIRRRTAGDDPHPLRMSEYEDDFWAVQVDFGEDMISARRFTKIVASVTGVMATLKTIHPEDFIRIKRELGKSQGRDALKARKDLAQADAVEELLSTYPEAFSA